MFLAVLRYGATTRPGFAGAMAGLLAGGLAATFYAAHCPDDSPLFVATWYTIAIAAMALASALIATPDHALVSPGKIANRDLTLAGGLDISPIRSMPPMMASGVILCWLHVCRSG